MSENKYRNEMTITLNEHEYKLRATFNAMVAIENRSGMSLPKLAQNFGNGDVRASQLFDILDEGCKAAKAPYDVNQLKEDIATEGSVAVTMKLTQFFSTALYGGSVEKKDSE